jgi:hypothetical protein
LLDKNTGLSWMRRSGKLSPKATHARRRIKAALAGELAVEKQDAAQLAVLRCRVQKALARQLPLESDWMGRVLGEREGVHEGALPCLWSHRLVWSQR